LGVFLNIYLWRVINNLGSVALFNLFFFIGIPISFIVNGLLLRKIPYVSAFRFGILAQGVFPLIIIFSQERVLQYLALLGFIKGFGEAFYWGTLTSLQIESEAIIPAFRRP
jgi:YQGE family putative transporter